MSRPPFAVTFLRQFRYWTIHCSLNALPSFCIALSSLNLWKSPTAVAAMISAISTFILLYATLTSLNGPLANENHVLARSLKLGAKIRAWISVLSLFVVFTPAASISPDFWCGFISVMLVNYLSKSAGGSGNSFNLSGVNVGFLPVYATTLIEGFILSFVLLMISFFAVIFLQARDRKKFFTGAHQP